MIPTPKFWFGSNSCHKLHSEWDQNSNQNEDISYDKKELVWLTYQPNDFLFLACRNRNQINRGQSLPSHWKSCKLLNQNNFVITFSIQNQMCRDGFNQLKAYAWTRGIDGAIKWWMTCTLGMKCSWRAMDQYTAKNVKRKKKGKAVYWLLSLQTNVYWVARGEFLHLYEICASKEDGELYLPQLGSQDKLHKILPSSQSVWHNGKTEQDSIVSKDAALTEQDPILPSYLYCRLWQAIHLIDWCTDIVIVLIEG